MQEGVTPNHPNILNNSLLTQKNFYSLRPRILFLLSSNEGPFSKRPDVECLFFLFLSFCCSPETCNCTVFSSNQHLKVTSHLFYRWTPAPGNTLWRWDPRCIVSNSHETWETHCVRSNCLHSIGALQTNNGNKEAKVQTQPKRGDAFSKILKPKASFRKRIKWK